MIMKKVLAIIIALSMMIPVGIAVNAEDTAFVPMYVQDFNDFISSIDNQTVTTDPDSTNKFLRIGNTNSWLQINDIGEYSCDESFSMSFKVRFTNPTGMTWANGYFTLQMLDDSSEVFSFLIAPGSPVARYNQPGAATNQMLKKNSSTSMFTSCDTTKWYEIVVTVNSNKLNVTFDGIPAMLGGYSGSDAMEGTLPSGATINSIKLAHRGNSYTNAITDLDAITFSQSVTYDASALTGGFVPEVIYPEEGGTAIKLDGTVTTFLNQQVKFSLYDETDTLVKENFATASVKKAVDGSGTFTLEEATLPAEVAAKGNYKIVMKQYIGSEAKGVDAEKELYIARAEDLLQLPADFSELPENLAEAEEIVEGYLPALLTAEELETLFPAEDSEEAAENLTFITKYFKNSNAAYADLPAVKTDFNNAKVILKINNATDNADVLSALNEGAYLDEFAEDKIFIDNQESFFTLFETKRTDSENQFLSISDVKNAVRFAYSLTALNAVERSGIKSIVESYNDVFGLDINNESIAEISEDDLYAVLYGKDYTDVETIQGDFNTKLAELVEKKEEIPEEDKESGSGSLTGGSSGSGGGGGGGSFSGGNKKPSITTDEPVPKPEIAPEEPKTTELTDIKGHWAEKEITVLEQKGIINGYDDNTFKPDNTLTRAEFVTMLIKIVSIDEVGENIFADIKEDEWYYNAAVKAASMGIVNGINGNFMPNENITREQLAVMIYRALGKNEKLNKADFADWNNVSEYAEEAISYLTANGIMSGYPDSTVRPQGSTTRAEAAKLLYMAFSY